MKFKSYFIIITALTVSTTAHADTYLFLHDAYSKLGVISKNSNGYGCASGLNQMIWRLADTNQGTLQVSQSFAPTSTSPPCLYQTANGGGDYLLWISPPIAAAITISGNIDYQAGCKQSPSKVRAGFGYTIQRWSPRKGIVSTVQVGAVTSSECNTTAGLLTVPAAAPTATAFKVGDRIVVRLEVQLAGSGQWGGDGSHNTIIYYDDVHAGIGDSWAHFADAITFSADSPNGTPVVH